jgi:hypothetical protein
MRTRGAVQPSPAFAMMVLAAVVVLVVPGRTTGRGASVDARCCHAAQAQATLRQAVGWAQGHTLHASLPGLASSMPSLAWGSRLATSSQNARCDRMLMDGAGNPCYMVAVWWLTGVGARPCADRWRKHGARAGATLWGRAGAAGGGTVQGGGRRIPQASKRVLACDAHLDRLRRVSRNWPRRASSRDVHWFVC